MPRIRHAAVAADILSLAAAPTFALMAALSPVVDTTQPGPCTSGAAGAPLGGMVLMYGLMCVFHAAPWLRVLRGGGPVGSPPATQRR
ncbi:MAG: hypothetical protein RLO51_24385 [Thalassobaculum sp.]|uniref:hypothetical protein n=1 Tax=Thalassobaculum sp. TaxID=2022740 RepID=UPI0032ED8F3A